MASCLRKPRLAPGGGDIQTYANTLQQERLVAQSVANPNQRPWVGLGPYWWTDGTRGRADGLQWLCSDTGDGTHPSASGLAKTNSLLRSMFVNSVYTPWFTRSVTTPNPSPSPTPSPSPSPSATPGPSGTGLAIVNALRTILFNGSQLRGSCDGNFVPNPDPMPVSSPWPAGVPVAISAVPCMVLVYGSPQTGVCTGTFRPS